MGRQKSIPKKVELGPIDYIPHKRRKQKRKPQQTRTHNVRFVPENSKKFHVIRTCIGSSNSVIPEHWKVCKASFVAQQVEEEQGILVLDFDGVNIVVELTTVDATFLKGVISSKAFAVDFQIESNLVYCDIYFSTLPLKNSPNIVRMLFAQYFGIEYTVDETMVSPSQSLDELTELYKNIKLTRERDIAITETGDMQHERLKPQLRPYQQSAVRWMLHREKQIVLDQDTIHPLYVAVTLKSGLEIYYNKYTGQVELEKPLIHDHIKGGILADEMGLGKTVEILATILNHTRPDSTKANVNLELEPVIDKGPSRKRKIETSRDGSEREESDAIFEIPIQDGNRPLKDKNTKIPIGWVKPGTKKSRLKVALESYYDRCLKEYEAAPSTTIRARGESEVREKGIQCVCGYIGTSGNVFKCVDCEKKQHGRCVNYKTKYGPYRCAQCWIDQPLIESAATLIVTPVSLKNQWCNEIRKHVKGDMKVLVYSGSSSSPVYPTALKDYDVVITTYSVLQAELRLTENSQVMEFRNHRKYSPPGCSLTRIKWWRLCLDEAQIVEVSSTMVAEMAKKLSSELRWAVTGTPISKEISDLYGLMAYLQIEPYDDPLVWKHMLYNPYIDGDKEPMHRFLAQVMWRSSKNDVIDQIDIPPQRVEEHCLQFSLVEEHFYKCLHSVDTNSFLIQAKKFESDTPIQNLNRALMDKLLLPLLSLRQACTYPNSVRSRYFATKKPVTSMADLVEALLMKNSNENEETLRSILNSLNGLAGIHLLLKEPAKAVEEYRKVLQLNTKYTEEEPHLKLVPDKLPIIHTLYNLAEVLNNHPDVVSRTLKDDTLVQQRIEVEQKYISKFIKQSVATYQSCAALDATVEKLRSKFTLEHGQWYIDLLNWIETQNYSDELWTKIINFHTDANVTSIVGEHQKNQIRFRISDWDATITELRENSIETVRALYTHNPEEEFRIVIPQQLVRQATNCHLRPEKTKNAKNSRVKKCPFCVANDILKEYELALYTIAKRTETFEEMALVGSWKQRSEELILRCIFAVGKAKRSEMAPLKDAENHMHLLETMKKEFKEVRKLWTDLSQQVSAMDELDICKTRLCLKESDPAEDKKKNKLNATLRNLDYHNERKSETIHILEAHELEFNKLQLRAEEKDATAKLQKNLGVRNYLETLKKQQVEGNKSADPCPICKSLLEKHWSLLPCGHSYCLECIRLLNEQNHGHHIVCSICRATHLVTDISFVRSDAERASSLSVQNRMRCRGNFSTKVEGVIDLIVDLKTHDPMVKVLVYSSWVPVVAHLRDAMEKNNIKTELVTTSRLEKQIENFKDLNQGVTALLLPIHLGSKGLNLIEATHVILVEPLLNPADELQAIGRIHRIGQTKSTVVHKFYVKGTIEESIFNATKIYAADWEKNKVTVGNLIKLLSLEDAE